MMAEMILPLARTVFLPKGSPGICTVREIKADIRRFEMSCEEGRIFCTGEADLLIEYLSFAEGEQYPGYEAYEQRIPGGGSMWQALLTLPFELEEEGDLPCPPLAQLTVKDVRWYMVAPHALETEMDLLLCWQEEKQAPPSAAPEPHILSEPQGAGWRQVSVAEMEREYELKRASEHNIESMAAALPAQAASILEQAVEEIRQAKPEAGRTDIKVILGGARLPMEKDDKIMHMGVSDQGWRLTGLEEDIEEECAAIVTEEAVTETVMAEEAITEEAAIETVMAEEAITEEAAIETVMAEEAITEELAAAETVVQEIITQVVVEEVIITAEQPTTEARPEPKPQSAAAGPVIMMQTVETPYQPQPQAQPEVADGLLTGMVAEAKEEARQVSSRRCVSGLPRLQVRREQIRQSANYQVSFRIEDK